MGIAMICYDCEYYDSGWCNNDGSRVDDRIECDDFQEKE